MSWALALLTSDPNLLRCELDRLALRVAFPEATEVNAVGVGSYAGDEVLLRRFGGQTPRNELFDVPTSDALVYHSQQLPIGMSHEDTEPLRFRRWLFCHIGPPTTPVSVRRHIERMFPESLSWQLGGRSASELCFALFHKQLREANHTDEDRLEPKLAAEVLGRAVRHVADVWAEAGTRVSLDFIATDGDLLLATRTGKTPLHYTLVEGTGTCARCRIGPSSPESDPLIRTHRRVRTVAVTSSPGGNNGWVELEHGSALAVGRDLQVRTVQF